MSTDTKWGGIPRDRWFCAVHGAEPTGPPGLCTCNPPQTAGTSYPLHTTQLVLDGLAETIAGMLDDSLHLEACWISEDETRCQCIIGQLRACLPRCGHVEPVGVKGLTRQCLSTVHPSAPYKHVFGVA